MSNCGVVGAGKELIMLNRRYITNTVCMTLQLMQVLSLSRPHQHQLIRRASDYQTILKVRHRPDTQGVTVEDQLGLSGAVEGPELGTQVPGTGEVGSFH